MDKSTAALFEEVMDALNNYADIKDGPEGKQLPNDAMAALTTLDEIRERYEATLQAAHELEKSADEEALWRRA